MPDSLTKEDLDEVEQLLNDPAKAISYATMRTAMPTLLSLARAQLEGRGRARDREEREHEAGASEGPVDTIYKLWDLCDEFAAALFNKLLQSERKYGWNNGWMNAGWGDDLRRDIRRHIEKGDPRDVAAYCAFAWHHGWSLAQIEGREAGGELVERLRAGASTSPDVNSHWRKYQALCDEAADALASLQNTRDTWKWAAEAKDKQILQLSDALAAKEQELERMREALGDLLHAVCGETGFAECVRRDSGKAYPWPALDEAEKSARAALGKDQAS